MKNLNVLTAFIFSITFLRLTEQPCLAQQESIPSKILKLREETEKGISYFISKDFNSSITTLSNSILLADEIILSLSDETTSPKTETDSIALPDAITKDDKSIIVTTVRKSTTEAIKFYIVGKIDKSIEKINTIKSISKSVTEEAYKSIREIEYKKSLEEKLSSVEKLREFEKELISKSKDEKPRFVYITNLITKTKFVTNVITRYQTTMKNVEQDKNAPILLVITGTVGFVALFTILIITIQKIRIKKRIKDISEIM
ncbi:MAG: hypothetical protein N2712_01320 [Brevinematales bacterium]|nr:hypothetical protein [Brevinematales bacterium]